MIDLKSFSREALDYAFGTVEDEEEARELYLDIMEKVHEIEQEDDKNGTNKLERLLEKYDAAWIALEYGLLD